MQSVETEGVHVHWQCKALSDSVSADFRESQPPSYVTGDNMKRLRRLNLFEACMLQINDKNYLTIEESDILNLVRKSQWRKDRGLFCKFVMFCVVLSSLKFFFVLVVDSNKTLLNQLKKKAADEKELAAHEKDLAANSDNNATEDGRQPPSPTPLDNAVPFRSVEANCEGKKLSAAKAKLGGSINAKLALPSDGGLEQHIESTIAKMFRTFDHQHCRNVSESDGWNTDEDDDENSCSGDSLTSCCSSPTPRNSPKRSPLFNKKVNSKHNVHFNYSLNILFSRA